MTIAAGPFPETGADPGLASDRRGRGRRRTPVSARGPGTPPRLRRWLAAPLWVHVVALILLLGALAPLLELDSSFTSDEGAYAHQVHALQRGGWPVRQVTDPIDPGGRWFGMVNGSQGPNGNFTYTAHPLVVVVMARLASVLGDDVGLHLLPLAGVVGTAIAAWLLVGVVRPTDADTSGAAGRSGPFGRSGDAGSVSADDGRASVARASDAGSAVNHRRVPALAFWVAATGPVLVNSTIIWAHTASAALAGLSLVAGLWVFQRGVKLGPLVLLGATVAGGVLIRSEGLLFAFALTAVLLVGLGLARAPKSVAAVGMAAGVPAVAAYLCERRWQAHIVGGQAVVPPAVRQVTGSWLSGRMSGGWHDLLNPNAADLVAGLLGGVALAVFVFAGWKLRRLSQEQGRRRQDAGEIAGLLAIALVCLVARTILRPNETVTGLFAAWPIVVVGWLAGGQLRRVLRSATERLLVAVVVLFGAAVFATGYAEGGGQEWGGRFYFPMLVPLAVLAVVWLTEAARHWPASDRRRLWAPLVAVAVVPSLLGLVVVRELRVHTNRIAGAVAATGAPVVVTNSLALPRAAWKLRGVAWLRVEPADLPEVVDRLTSAGIGPVAVVERTATTGSAAPLGGPAPAQATATLARAGYTLRLVNG